MPSQRARGAESRVRNRLSNGPPRVQSNAVMPQSILQRVAYVSCRGYEGIPSERTATAVKQGGIADDRSFVLDREENLCARAFFYSIFSSVWNFIIAEAYIMQMNGVDFETYFNNYPDKDGYFGKFGGRYIDDKLKKAMEEITEAYYSIC